MAVSEPLARRVSPIWARFEPGVMTTQTPQINRIRRLAGALIIVAGLGCLVSVPVARADDSLQASSYGWPVRPFHRQHPVRGFFGDPRIAEGASGTTHSFHFGIDISCPDGTAVYATMSGEIVIEGTNPETVSIVGADGRTTFSYWHVVPSVRNGEIAVAYGTLLGHVAKGWAHVHFAESIDGAYVNPLRRGALSPYADHTQPTLESLRLEHGGAVLKRVPAFGTVDLVVEASDTTPIAIAAPWHDKPVTPALIRWRIPGTSAWQTSIDVRRTIPSNTLYGRYFATWTRQNSPWGRTGRYRFFLAHDLDAAVLSRCAATLEIQATDTRGNTTTRR